MTSETRPDRSPAAKAPAARAAPKRGLLASAKRLFGGKRDKPKRPKDPNIYPLY